MRFVCSVLITSVVVIAVWLLMSSMERPECVVADAEAAEAEVEVLRPVVWLVVAPVVLPFVCVVVVGVVADAVGLDGSCERSCSMTRFVMMVPQYLR